MRLDKSQVKVGQFISIGGTAGVNPATGQLAGSDVYSQAKQILESFRVMLQSVGSDLGHVIHINIFLKDMRDFEEMNRAYVGLSGEIETQIEPASAGLLFVGFARASEQRK